MLGSKLFQGAFVILAAGAVTLGGFCRDAHASPEPFIYSAIGPGQGQGALSLGGRGFIVTEASYIPLPTFELNYVRGLTNAFDFELHVSTLGVLTLADVGGKVRLFGDERFSLGLRADGTALVVALSNKDGTAAGSAAGATPGLVMSFGGSRTQFSLGCDVPMFFGAAALSSRGDSAAASGFSYSIRPAATIEFPVGDSTNMYLQGQVWVVPPQDGDKSTHFLPTIALGAAW